MHMLDPVTGAYLPAAHGKHHVEPETFSKRPTVHAVQFEAPMTCAYLPGAQSMQ